MKINTLIVAAVSLVCISSQVYSDQKHSISSVSSHPASQEWVQQQITLLTTQVQQQIALLTTQLTPSDWNAACSSGSPANPGGCFGNVSSAAFAKINAGIGGFITIANINTTNAPAGSVFIKAFFAGTNTPVSATNLTVTSSNIARCGVYLQQGTGTDTLYGGSINTSTTNGDTAGPVAAHPIVVNTGTVVIGLYSGSNTPAPPQQPLYLVCAGVTGNGATAASIAGITAI
jgi:hypothetical protein